MKRLLYLLVFFPLFWGCSNYSDLIRSNDYQTKEIEGRHLLILPVLTDSIKVSDQEAIDKYFPGNYHTPQQILRDCLYAAFTQQQNYQVTTDKIDIDSAKSLDNASNRVMLQYPIDQSDSAHAFYIPKKEWLLEQGKTPDLIMVITGIEMGRAVSTNAAYFSPGGYSSTPLSINNAGLGVQSFDDGTRTSSNSSRGTSSAIGAYVSGGGVSKLQARFDFIIYDYKKNTFIAYGTPAIKTGLSMFGLTRSNWDALFDDVVKVVFSKTRFLK